MCVDLENCASHVMTSGEGTATAPECSTWEAGHWSVWCPGWWACKYGAPTIRKKARMPNKVMLRT